MTLKLISMSVPDVGPIYVQDWLGGLDIKYYESKINLNWKPILKSIISVCPHILSLY